MKRLKSRKRRFPCFLIGLFLCAGVAAMLMTAGDAFSAMAGSGKFVGNITHRSQIPSDFATYWNQITAENEGKWDAVEGSRDTMNWAGIDRAYNYAKQHNMPYKQHTFVWGSQYPGWMNNISANEQKAEVEEWIQAYCKRYPDTPMIDVVNEPDHKRPSWYTAIGGAGSSGHDWIIWSFQKARQYCPNSKLILNDYNVLRWDTDKFIAIANKIKAKGLLDGVGCQAHGLESQSFSELQANFKKIKGIGVPIYISEYDVDIADDNKQRQVMSQQFPLFYEDSQVAGITIWGYIYGQTWIPNSGLIKNGSPRPALTWLRSYLSSHSSPTTPTDPGTNPGGCNGGSTPPANGCGN
jgi:GH35 family endo-1,4-beta-xylanase